MVRRHRNLLDHAERGPPADFMEVSAWIVNITSPAPILFNRLRLGNGRYICGWAGGNGGVLMFLTELG